MKFIQLAVAAILDEYEGNLPLAHFLKPFFKARPKLGSRDRRAIADAVYTYYRLAKFVENSKVNVWGIIQWALQNGVISNPQLQKTCDIIQPDAIVPKFELEAYTNVFSEQIEASNWYASILQIPKTFIRLRVAAFNIVPILNAKGLNYEQVDAKSLAFPNGYNLADALPEGFYVVQDYSSQKSLDALVQHTNFSEDESINVWDSCSGAGGKMLLLKDSFPKAYVLCTDVRKSILHNLRERAKIYYHKNISTQVLDSSDKNAVSKLQGEFDVVIADVPCSGSGTWARTPEQFHFFDVNKIQSFAALQTKIALNAFSKVKSGGYFLYITCSVFKSENEQVVAHLLSQHSDATLLHQSIVNGMEHHADCMFVALIKK